MSRKRLVALLVVAASLTLPVPLSGAADADVVWWGPTGIDEGWHMRVLLHMTNPYGVPLVDAPVAAELDLASLLVDAGWPSVGGGDLPIPESFELDFDSVRVVEMTNFDPPQSGTSDGRLLAYDRGLSGDERYEVPRLVLKGLLGFSQNNDELIVARPYDGRTNPAITVLFRAPGETAAGATRAFVVYFDSVAHGGQSAPGPRPLADAALQAIHWAGPGIRLYGHVVEEAGPPRAVEVVGLHPGTTVQLFTLQAGSFAPVGDAVALAAGQHETIGLGSSAAQVLRLDADKPVLAFVQPVGFVPTVHGGFVGFDFAFPTSPAAEGGNGVYLTNLNEGRTVVRIDSAGGAARELHLSDSVNPLPYGGSRTCNNDGGAWVGLPGGLDPYTATVLEGGPVMVQLQPVAMSQMPSRQGAPVGTTFLAAAQWTTSDCGTGQGQHFYALAEGGPGTLTVQSLEAPVQVFPQGSPANPNPGGRSLPAAPEYEGPFDLRPVEAANRDRPLLFEATGPLRIFAGGPSPTPQVPAIAGPLGGVAGRDHAGFGESIILVPYSNTHLSVRVERSLSGVQTFERDRGGDDVVRLSDDGSDRVLSLQVNASRPVFVYPAGADPGFLAGVPSFLDVDALGAEFRGRLLALQSGTGVTPMTGSVRPAESITYTIGVANLARGVAGQDVTEAVRLTVGDAAAGWAATLDRDALSVGGGEQETVRLTVTPPPDAPSGQAVLVSVSAFSEANPEVRDVLDTVTSVRRTFGVGLWFEFVDGPKTLSQNVGAGDAATYRLVVQNRGSSPDTIRLTPTPPELGWELLFLDEAGLAVDEVDLVPGESQELELRVTAPSEAQDAVEFTTVTAQSTQASAAVDRVTAVTKVRAPADVVLEAVEPILRVTDGTEAAFEIRLSNEGQGAAEVRLALASATPEGWPSPQLFLRDATGSRVPVEEINLLAGEDVMLIAAQDVPLNTSAAVLGGVRVAGTVAGSQQAPEALLTAVVAPRHDVNATVSPAPPLHVGAEGSVDFNLQLANRGNVNESIRLEAASLPPGWTLTAVEDVGLPQAGSDTVPLTLRAPPGAASGAYEVAFRLVSADGNTTKAYLAVVVERLLRGKDYSLGVLPTRPGAPLPLDVPFHNSGNAPVDVRLESDPQDAWTVSGSTPVRLTPGANATLEATVEVPLSAPDGITSHRVRLVIADAAGALPPANHGVRFEADVARTDLRIEDVFAGEGPGGLLVHLVVHNSGPRTARDVGVALVDSRGSTTARGTLDVVPAEGSATMLLAVPGGAGDDLRLVVDPENVVAETDEANNVRLVSPPAGEAVPVPLWALLAAVAAAIACRRLAVSLPGK